VVQDDVVRAEVSGGAAAGPDAAPRDAAAHGGVELTLRQARKRERYDRVILATGFEARPPADGVVAATASAEGLPVNSEGYPALDRSLRWGKGLYVASALAELELGPMAPNIYGAHAAARRILPALAGDEQAKRVLFPWNPIRELGASA
jgi:lysine/ornithine N-monooxygenase